MHHQLTKTSHNKTIQLLAESGLTQITRSATQLSPQETARLINTVVRIKPSQWEHKIRSIIACTSQSNSRRLQHIGSQLTPKSFLALLGQRPQKKLLTKLPALLQGMHPTELQSLLIAANLKQLNIFKTTVLSPPIQQHLALIIEQFSKQETTFTEELDALKRSIAAFQCETVILSDIQDLEQRLHTARETIDHQLATLDRTLIFAWHGGQTDLVENLTDLKEYYRNDLRIALGHPAPIQALTTYSDESNQQHLNPLIAHPAATGLHQQLELKLREPFALYPGNTPAKEALPALGIRTVADLEELRIIKKELSTSSESGNRDQSYKDTIHWIAERLQHSGLFTVDDFIQQRITNKSMLKTLINKTQLIIS